MKVTVALGMAVGTVAIALLTRVDAHSTYGDFVIPLIVLGLAIGLSLSPCTNAIMGSFPEDQLGIGGAVNSTSIELGGSLGIAVLGTVLANTYSDNLADAAAKSAAAGAQIPEKVLGVAQDSVGAGLAVSEQLAAKLGPQPGASFADAVRSAFSDSVAHTSVVGAVVLGVGTVIVAFLLPSRKKSATDAATDAPAEGAQSADRASERV